MFFVNICEINIPPLPHPKQKEVHSDVDMLTQAGTNTSNFHTGDIDDVGLQVCMFLL